MKYLFRFSFMFVLVAFFAVGSVAAQERENTDTRPSPNALVSQTIGTTVITVTYGRPGIKDRSYFEEDSDLAPIGSIWRTGANESTTITFSEDVKIDGNDLEAGTYSMFTVPGEDEWGIIFNSVAEQWGAYAYEEHKEKDVLSVTVPVEEATEQEWFQISFDELTDTEANINLHWGTTIIKVPISTE